LSTYIPKNIVGYYNDNPANIDVYKSFVYTDGYNDNPVNIDGYLIYIPENITGYISFVYNPN